MGYKRKGRKGDNGKVTSEFPEVSEIAGTTLTGEKLFEERTPRVYPKAAKAVSSQATEKSKK